jgi:hypothetical protein
MTVHKIHTRMVFDSTTGELEEDEFYYHDTEVDGPIAMAEGDSNEGGGESQYEAEMDRLKNKSKRAQKAIRAGVKNTRYGASGNALSGTTLSAATVSVGLYGKSEAYNEHYGGTFTAREIETRGRDTGGERNLRTTSVVHAVKAANLGTGAYAGKSTAVRRAAAERMLRRAGVTDGSSYLNASFGTAGVAAPAPAPGPAAAAPAPGGGGGGGGPDGDVAAIGGAVAAAGSILAQAATGYGTGQPGAPNAMWPGAPSWVKSFSDYQRWIRMRSSQQGFYSTIIGGGGGTTLSGTSSGSSTSSYVTSLTGS